MQSFVKIKSLRSDLISLSFTDIGKPCASRKFFSAANFSFNAIRENKIHLKISGFTVFLETTFL